MKIFGYTISLGIERDRAMRAMTVRELQEKIDQLEDEGRRIDDYLQVALCEVAACGRPGVETFKAMTRIEVARLAEFCMRDGRWDAGLAELTCRKIIQGN